MRSRANCCVVGCTNTYATAPPNTKFYSFPARTHELEKRKRWMSAVKRVTKDGKPWEPSRFSLICSQHFLGGAKSDHPHSPAYVPSLFPSCYRKRTSATAMERFKRARDRRPLDPCAVTASSHGGAETTCAAETEEPVLSDHKADCESVYAMIDCDTQTDDTPEDDVEIPIMFCCIDIGGSGTLTALPPKKVGMHSKVTRSVGLDPMNVEEMKRDTSFRGFASVQCKPRAKQGEILRSLTSVQYEAFMMLLNIVLRSLGKPENVADFLLFLMKMKLGLSFSALGVLFGIHRTTAMRHFHAVLKCLRHETRIWIFWPSAAAVRSRLPKAFQDHYPSCRAIIDCTEIPICKPKHPHEAALTYSSYKGTYTAKILLAVSPCGFISFVSKAYGGRSGDNFITSDSGFLQLIEPGDLILSDKGFPSIKSSLEEGVVVMPPFARGGEQFSAEEVDETYRIASVRIHVERCIRRMKLYSIMSQKMNVELMPYIDDIVHVCAVLANLQPPIIQEEADNDES